MIELNKVYNEDCLIGMQRIADKSVDLILCDLPYGTTNCKWDSIMPFEPLWEQYERIIKNNGAIVLTASQPFTSALVMSNPKMFKYEWIWQKNIPTGFLNAKKQPLRVHESVLVFYGAQCTYNPIKEARKGQGKERVKYVVNGGDGSDNYGKYSGSSKLLDEQSYPKTVQLFNKETGLHPTQKPVTLFEYLIKTYSNEGEIVLDNCIGSGTTAIACINTNRNFIGFEKDITYHALAEERIRKHIEVKSIPFYDLFNQAV